MKKTILIMIVILAFTIELLSFSEPIEIDNDLNGELLINYEKNVQVIDGKLWILYYDVSIHPLTTYLKLAREQEDGSFEVMELCNMNIATGVRSQLDCTFAVQDEEVTVFYMKTYSNIEDVRVFKIHSNNLMNNYQELEFSSQYSNIAEMSLELSGEELVLILLRGNAIGYSGMNSLYYEYSNDDEFTGQDEFNGPVYSKDNIYIHQTGQGNNNGWPTFHDFVITDERIIDVSTGSPAIFSAPMDMIFLGGFIEESSSDYELPENVEDNFGGFILENSIDRDLVYVKIDGTAMTYRYADIETHLDTIMVCNSFPDAEHNDLAIGDSIWTNVVEVKEYDWDESTSTIILQNQSMLAYCPMWLEGSVSGRMTIASTDTIYITRDLIYNSVSPGQDPINGWDYLGVVSDKSIVIKYKNYDPDSETYNDDNCDGVYIYAFLAVLGEVDYNNQMEPTAGNLQVEYLHPHGSTPGFNIEFPNGNIWEVMYPDLHKFIFPPSPYWSGPQGFLMHSNAMPAGYPCCGYPYEHEDYGNGIVTPYGTDHPWYNPVYPESSEDIVFDRGTIELYGALYERGFHNVHCNGVDPDAHYNNIWNPDEGLYGGTHVPCGYELNIHYDERYNYCYPPEIVNMFQYPEHRVTILHSTNGGDSFVQRYDQLIDNNGLNINKNLQSVEEDGIIAFAYNCFNECRIDYWDTDSFGMTTESFSLDEFTGNIKSLRLLENILYFQDDEEIYELESNYLYPISDLLEADFVGFNFETADRIQWVADWQGYDLDFSFYAADEYWDFDDIGESIYEYGYDVDYFNLEDIYLKVYGQREAQLFLHGREYNEDTFYLARDQIEASTAGSDEISEIVNMKIYPNPFIPGSVRSDCMISYTIPEAQSGEIGIYNIKGQFLNKWQVESSGEISINASDYKSGVYLLRIQCDGREIERKLSIIK